MCAKLFCATKYMDLRTATAREGLSTRGPGAAQQPPQRMSYIDQLYQPQGPSYTMTGANQLKSVNIAASNNEYTANPFQELEEYKRRQVESAYAGKKYTKDVYEQLDLNIDNYSRENIYSLFGMKPDATLTEDVIRESRKIALKTHPDKSRLDPKYYVFFSKAFNKLLEIYEYQNKTSKQVDASAVYSPELGAATGGVMSKALGGGGGVAVGNGEYQNEDMARENKAVLDKYLASMPKEGGAMNEWFNKAFEQQKIEKPSDKGYGDWLKSDEGIVFHQPATTRGDINSAMDKYRQKQEVVAYTGDVQSFNTSTFGGMSLMDYKQTNFSSDAVFTGGGLGYTDLKQAYTQSVMTVSEEDFNRMRTFKSVDEYRAYSDANVGAPMSKDESAQIMLKRDQERDAVGADLAHYYSTQSAKVAEKSNSFWSNLKQIMN